MFITALLVTVIGLPMKVPPDQFNWPAMVTGAVRLTVPFETVMMSLVAGTPLGLQLLGLNQSLFTEPVQVRFVWADAKLVHKARPRYSPRQCRQTPFLNGERSIWFRVTGIIAYQLDFTQRFIEQCRTAGRMLVMLV